MLRHLPNFLTCCNLLCGCFAIVFLLNGVGWPVPVNAWFSSLELPAFFVWIACVFDFFDGFAARALKVSSPIGKELDSLADMVSFGLLPSMVMFIMIKENTTNEMLPYIAFLMAVCSALRLAIFNVDETQKDSFRGVPTPANTLFITSLPFIGGAVGQWLRQDWVLVIITLLFSLLLVARFELFALKFKNFRWTDNKVRFTFLAFSVLLLAVLHILAIPVIILSYIILSLGIGLVSKS
jgi:CDP-diacylglycerol--serine O-phosphatidyltransferase